METQTWLFLIFLFKKRTMRRYRKPENISNLSTDLLSIYGIIFALYYARQAVFNYVRISRVSRRDKIVVHPESYMSRRLTFNDNP